nr:mitofilin family membrane protein [Govania unica]
MLTLRIGQLESAFVPLSERATKAIESARSQKEILAGQAQLASSITTLEDRLQTLEHSAAGDRRGTLIALSFAALREIANRGRPFAAEYDALSGLLAESNQPELASELQTVAAYAPSGAPSFSSLRTSFDEAAAAILHAAAIPEGANWWRRAIAEFKSLVTIRPTGDVSGTTPDAIIARTEQRLGQNDLAAAVRELKTLPKPAAAAAAPWLRGAEARLAVDEALSRFASVLIHATALGTDHNDAAPAQTGKSRPAISPDSGA